MAIRSPGLRLAMIALAGAMLAACQTNPVTGQRDLQFYDVEWEREKGEALYLATRQGQGGDYNADPQVEAYVRDIGERLAANARRADQLDFEFNVVNDGTPNAWALPGGKIAIHRGLLTELESEAELAAVLGHEIVHADAAHGARSQSRGTVTQIGALAAAVILGSQADSAGEYAAAIGVPTLAAQLITQKYGRDAEREADYYGMIYMEEVGYDPQGAVELQETFVRLSEGNNPGWINGLFASHPPSPERVERNRETAAELPPGGETGRERYQRMMARLERSRPAYDKYEQALKAGNAQQYGQARRLVDQAIEIEAREALFHTLRGDLELVADRRPQALPHYRRATELNPEYFYPALQAGTLLGLDGERAAARRLLERSVGLLPTAQGYYFLGTVERDSGNVAAARQHFQRAAKSDSQYGRAARQALAALGG